MHALLPARLKPGVSLDDLPASVADRQDAVSRTLIRGKTLIFWDPKAPHGTKKLDGIDNDQTAPGAVWVSEILASLDERWKAVAFRYLMPDFRARVHRGETFLVAGDRFAIGSPPGSDPGGPKAGGGGG